MKSSLKHNILSPTKEDYLRAIFVLGERGTHAEFNAEKRGTKKIGVTQIANYLGLSKSTVSERLHELMAQKLIKPGFYSSIEFTKRGYTAAKNLTYKHRLIEVFLHKTLKLPKSAVHKEAHKLEHAFSDNVIKRLTKFLKNPSTDPHGRKIKV